MSQFAEDPVAEVRARADIVEIIGESVVLKRSGRNFTGLCPFHQERTPSFNVNPERQIFRCFGCGEFFKDRKNVGPLETMSQTPELAYKPALSREDLGKRLFDSN